MLLRTGLALVLSMGALAVHATDSFLLVDDDTRLEREPCVAVDERGNTVFAWASQVPGGAQPLDCIRMRRFHRNGQEIGKELRIDALPGDLARNPAVAFRPGSGGFVVVWEGGAEGDKLRRRIWAQVFDVEGKPVGTAIRVDQIRLRHDYRGLPRGAFMGPEVSVAPSGEFVVVWRSDGRTSCDRFNISARRFSASGEPLADEFIVNRDRAWSQVNPDVGHDRDGGFVIVWEDGRWIGTDDEASVIRGRVYDSDGVARGHEFVVTPDGRTSVGPPDLAVAPDGTFVCSWTDGASDLRPRQLLARSFYPEGWPMGELAVVDPRTEDVISPKIALTGPAEFVIIWPDIAEDRLRSRVIMGRGFSFAGSATGEALTLSPATCLGARKPAVATSIGGVGALAWEVRSGGSVRGRRFVPEAPANTLPTAGAGPSLSQRIAAWREALLDQRTDTGDRIAAAERITCMRSEANTALADLVACMDEDDDLDVRSRCATGVAAVAIGPAQALAPLTRALTTLDQRGTGRSGGAEAFQAEHLGSAAAEAIGSFGEGARSAAPVLLESVGGKPGLLSAAAAKALGRTGDPSGIEKIAAFLQRSPRRFWPGYVTGLAELIDSEPAFKALGDTADRCISMGTGGGHRRGSLDLRSLDDYFRDGMERAGVTDEATIERTIEHARSRFVNGRIGIFESPVEEGNRLWFEWLDERLESFAKMMEDGRDPCGCVSVLASGVAAADPFEERSKSILSELLRRADPVCQPGILGTIESMGPRGAPLAETLSTRVFNQSAFRLETLRALVAVDPKSDEAVAAATQLLVDDNPKVRVVAVRALSVAGPAAILPATDALTVLLDDPDREVRTLADRALELAEAEAEVCGNSWIPVAVPNPEPSPTPAPRVGPMPPASDARPPRPIRTPVGRFGGTPKKPN